MKRVSEARDPCVLFQGWYAIRLAQWRKEQGLGGNLGMR